MSVQRSGHSGQPPCLVIPAPLASEARERDQAGTHAADGSPAAPGRPFKRSFTIGGHRTSLSLEAVFWEALKAAAAREKLPVSRLIARIDADRKGCGLSSAVRVWLLAHYRDSAAPGDR